MKPRGSSGLHSKSVAGPNAELMRFSNRTSQFMGEVAMVVETFEGASLQFAKPLPVRMNTTRYFVVVEIH
jgi:hypothetical protein